MEQIKPNIKKGVRCFFCGRSQNDWDKLGRKWASENDAAGYGVPGFIDVHGRAICDFCARDVTHAFSTVYPEEARREIYSLWHHHKPATASHP